MNYKDILDLIEILKELTATKNQMVIYRNSTTGRPELKEVFEMVSKEISEIDQLSKTVFAKLKAEIKAIK